MQYRCEQQRAESQTVQQDLDASGGPMPSSVEDILEDVMSSMGFAGILDRASSELLRMEEQNRFPAGLRVHPDMFEMMSAVRKKELDRGFPLLVLGLPVLPEASLGAEDYRIIH